MATYNERFGGYIADVPHLWFNRCDGQLFYFDELTQASVTPQINTIDINAGWSLFPVAQLPGQSTFDMQCTSGKFEADLFAMTNKKTFAENTEYEMPVTQRPTVSADLKVTQENEPVEGSVYIHGMKQGDAADAGVYVVNGKEITFAEDDATAGDVVMVSYMTTKAVQEINIDNKASAIGEAILKYPVYGSGDDCSDSAIKGYVLVRVYRARVTAQPGFDGSYKSASTFQFTLSAMDAKRDDGACYSIAYYPEV